MNFQSLKAMIDSLVKSYKCPECSNSISDANIDIIWAAWTTINIDIACSNCWKHSMVKTEVLSIDLTWKNISPENLKKLKNSLINKNGTIISPNNKIDDSEIMSLNKNLRKDKFDVSDLFWDNK